jgi:hypothetical protein
LTASKHEHIFIYSGNKTKEIKMSIEDPQLPPSLGVKQSVEERHTYPIGDIPEVASVLNNLHRQLLAAEQAQLPNPDSLYSPSPDREVTFEILSPGTDELSTSGSVGHSGEQSHDSQYIRGLAFLEQLKAAWGNNSEIVGCRLTSKQAGTDYTYLAVLLPDANSKIEAVVADTLGEKNAIYVWRRPQDESRSNDFAEVFSDKTTARQNGALRVHHTGSLEGINERVTNLLTMPLEQYEAEVAQRQQPKPQN